MALVKAKDPDIVHTIRSLLDKAETIYRIQRPSLPNFPYKYYVFNNYVLPSEIWQRDVIFTRGKLNPNPKVYTGPYNVNSLEGFFNYAVKTTFSEELSDDCLVEVAAASDTTELHDCPVSDKCLEYMTVTPRNYTPIFPTYGVTHRVLFLQIARNRNCNLNYETVNQLIEEECSYILWELRKNVEYGYIPNLDDIFMEQIEMCGKEGYAEFLEEDYLKHILDVQKPHGGFGPKHLTVQQLLNRNRPKRESVKMSYGANSHTTGLAAAVFGLYIRYFIEVQFNARQY